MKTYKIVLLPTKGVPQIIESPFYPDTSKLFTDVDAELHGYAIYESDLQYQTSSRILVETRLK